MTVQRHATGLACPLARAGRPRPAGSHWVTAILSTGLVPLLAAAAAAPTPRVEIGEPVLVLEAPAGETRWGRYQFPRLYPTADGSIVAFVHVEADAAEAYGLPSRAIVSRDRGGSWTPDTSADTRPHGLHLPNGDWFLIHTPPAIPVAGLAMPKAAGEAKNYGLTYTMYRLRELPPEMRLIFFRRYPRQGNGWRQESTELDDPGGLRNVVNGLLPRIWWGDIRAARDKSLVAVIYPAYSESQPRLYSYATAYRSADNGKNWKLQGRIFYRPDLRADPKGDDRSGFTEPALEVLEDGSLLCVLRTDDGLGRGPMYLTRSRDAGRTWTKPQAFTPTGVMPRLLRLANGTLVLTSGRPGVDLRFSFDGRGEKWTDPQRLVPLSPENAQADSCGYTDLLPLDRDSFLLIYSWFKRPGSDGQLHKSILARRVTVRPARQVR